MRLWTPGPPTPTVDAGHTVQELRPVESRRAQIEQHDQRLERPAQDGERLLPICGFHCGTIPGVCEQVTPHCMDVGVILHDEGRDWAHAPHAAALLSFL
jgi:hypothetical protein